MKIKIYICSILVLLLLSSCGSTTTAPTATPVDVNAIQTSVVETVVAAATQTVEAYTPTPEPTETIALTPTLSITETPTPPGITSTPTPIICNALEFLGDVTVPDGTTITAGEEFIKTWKVKNTGSCTWTKGYTVIFAYGDKQLTGQATPITNDVPPNTETEISVTFKAPLKAGNYSNYWRLADNNGTFFGTYLTVLITVP